MDFGWSYRRSCICFFVSFIGAGRTSAESSHTYAFLFLLLIAGILCSEYGILKALFLSCWLIKQVLIGTIVIHWGTKIVTT